MSPKRILNVDLCYLPKCTELFFIDYSLKIFPQFWLAKCTRIIHHNQLLMTKFGRILCLTRKWRQKCSPLQVKAPLTEKTWGGVELFSLWKLKWRTLHSDTSHGKNRKKTTRRATSAIWRIFAELNNPKRALLKINLTSTDRWTWTCFSHVFKLGIFLNE